MGEHDLDLTLAEVGGAAALAHDAHGEQKSQASGFALSRWGSRVMAKAARNGSPRSVVGYDGQSLRRAAVFAENDIDFDLLSQLTDEDLKDLGVASFGNRKRLLAAIAERNAKPLPAAPIPRTDERRQVTILFADLCGFTALSQSLDPEEVHELVSNYTSLVDNIVVEYEGTVDKHIGDAVMALFGAPQAHDDDPLRAARSALDIHDALDRLKDAKTPRLQAHIGIASGEVVAGRLKRANAHDYTVLGFGELGGPARRRRRAWADPAFRYGLSSPVGPRHL
jgi:class 3 adenylate cyclase